MIVNRRTALHTLAGASAGLALPFGLSLFGRAEAFAIQALEPFHIDFGSEAIDDLHRRIDRVRWPEMPFDPGWSTGTSDGVLTGISILPAPDGTFIHPRAADPTKLSSSHNRPAPEAVTSAPADVQPTGAPYFQGIPQTPLHTHALLRQADSLHLPRVSLPGPVAPRSSAACRRTAAGSDALLPTGASSTAHASLAGPRFSPVAAGDS